MENLKLLSISLRLYYFPMVPQFSGGNFNDSFRDTYPYYRRQYNHDYIFFFHFDYLFYTFLLKCFHYKRLHVLLGIFCFLHINRWNKAPIPCILSKNFLFFLLKYLFILSFTFLSWGKSMLYSPGWPQSITSNSCWFCFIHSSGITGFI